MLRIESQLVGRSGTNAQGLRVPAARFSPPSFYTRTDKMLDSISEFVSSCRGLVTQEQVIDNSSNRSLPVVKLGNHSATKPLFLTANMHARELITGEVAFHILVRLCIHGWPDFEQLLTSNAIVVYMMPVVNVEGRKLVDSGRTCLRKTSHGLDINRDGDYGWNPAVHTGAEPFATFQARIIRDLANRIKPQVFIDLHSGAGPMMTVPWGSKPEYTDQKKAQTQMLEVIRDRVCPSCSIGNTMTMVGYECPGILIDHMFAIQHIKYATLWEIWYDDAAEDSASFTWCQRRFNPVDHGQFNSTLTRWTDAVMLAGRFLRDNISAI